LRTAKNKTIKQSISQSVKNVNKMCFYALFRLSNNTSLGKNALGPISSVLIFPGSAKTIVG